MNNDLRAVSFGRDAKTYDNFRPDYPDEAIAHMLELADPDSAVEVGAGTGIGTRKVARDGLDLVCLEPSDDMADVLRARRLPGVSVVVSTFEDWPGKEKSADLIYAAQSWHWVDQEIGLDKARALLSDHGVLALLWNIGTNRFTGLEGVYQMYAPELASDRDRRIRLRDSHDWSEDMQAAGFTEISHFTHVWAREIGAADYRSLCSTYSDHILLEETKRERLLDEIERTTNEQGGSAILEYRTEVFTGRR